MVLTRSCSLRVASSVAMSASLNRLMDGLFALRTKQRTPTYRRDMYERLTASIRRILHYPRVERTRYAVDGVHRNTTRERFWLRAMGGQSDRVLQAYVIYTVLIVRSS